MSRIKGKNTRPELLLRKLLYSKGIRYRVHTSLPGKPDLVLTKKKICIFINGCFWHMHKGCKNSVIPKTNTDFWIKKLKLNVDRDYRNYNVLQKEGWKVHIMWECMIEKDQQYIVEEIINKIKNTI